MSGKPQQPSGDRIVIRPDELERFDSPGQSNSSPFVPGEQAAPDEGRTFSDSTCGGGDRVVNKNGGLPATLAFVAVALVSLVAVAFFLARGTGGPVDDATPPGPVATSPVTVHPVFQTFVTHKSSARPAIQVDVLDASEGVLFTAELYLAVQSSRFPADTWVILPVNRGDFAGCRSRFIQLPFEVQERDVLVFNLLDDDELTADEERMMLDACRTCGYCVAASGAVYSPSIAALIEPVLSEASEILGQVIVNDVQLHKFDNFGVAEFIVPKELPMHPQEANRLSITNTNNYVRMVLKLYGPEEPIVL